MIADNCVIIIKETIIDAQSSNSAIGQVHALICNLAVEKLPALCTVGDVRVRLAEDVGLDAEHAAEVAADIAYHEQELLNLRAEQVANTELFALRRLMHDSLDHFLNVAATQGTIALATPIGTP